MNEVGQKCTVQEILSCHMPQRHLDWKFSLLSKSIYYEGYIDIINHQSKMSGKFEHKANSRKKPINYASLKKYLSHSFRSCFVLMFAELSHVFVSSKKILSCCYFYHIENLPKSNSFSQFTHRHEIKKFSGVVFYSFNEGTTKKNQLQLL